MTTSSETQLLEELFIFLKLWGNIGNKLTVSAVCKRTILRHEVRRSVAQPSPPKCSFPGFDHWTEIT